MLCLFIGWWFCQFVCTCGRWCCHIFLWQMLLPLMYFIVADIIAIIHFWLMLLPFLCVAMIVWQMLLPLWLVEMPFDVIYVADVICQGGRWNSLPRWVWFMVRCYNHKWQMEWPQGHLFYFSFSFGLLHRTSSHMSDRWYLPMFLFRDGLLILIYRAALWF